MTMGESGIFSCLCILKSSRQRLCGRLLRKYVTTIWVNLWHTAWLLLKSRKSSLYIIADSWSLNRILKALKRWANPFIRLTEHHLRVLPWVCEMMFGWWIQIFLLHVENQTQASHDVSPSSIPSWLFFKENILEKYTWHGIGSIPKCRCSLIYENAVNPLEVESITDGSALRTHSLVNIIGH